MRDLYSGFDAPRISFSEVRLPPPPGRILRIAAGLAEWTFAEKAWLKEHPGFIAYQDQLQATLEDVQRELRDNRLTVEAEVFAIDPPPVNQFHI